MVRCKVYNQFSAVERTTIRAGRTIYLSVAVVFSHKWACAFAARVLAASETVTVESLNFACSVAFTEEYPTEETVIGGKVKDTVDTFALGVAAENVIAAVKSFAEHEEVIFSFSFREGSNASTEVVPEALLHVLERINAKAVDIG